MGQNLLVALTLITFSVYVILCEEFTCPRSRGYYPHPTECKKYYSCRKRVSTLKECPEEMLFDVKKGNCYINSAVDCGSRKKPSVTVVTMAEIRDENITEESWKPDLLNVTEPNMASSEESSSSVLPLRDNTSEVTATSTDHEHIANDSNYTVLKTSAGYTTANDLDNSDETFSSSTSRNKVTDNSELNITIVATTAHDMMRTSEEHENPAANDTTIAVTDFLHTSTVSSQDTIVDNSSYTVIQTSTDSNREDNDLNTSPGSTSGIYDDKLNVTSIASTETDTRTSEEHQSPASTEGGLNDKTSVSTNLDSSTISSWPHPSTASTDSNTDNGTSDVKRSTSVAIAFTNDCVHEISLSDLPNENASISNESDKTTETNEKSSTVDKESTIPHLSSETDYDHESTRKLDELSTIASNGTEFSHEEYKTTVKEPVRSTSSRIQTTVVSGEMEIGTTSSSKETIGPTDAKETEDVIIHSSTEPVPDLSTKKVTTEQRTTIIDDYYENDFDCPTAYGRYPHPTDKHKFLHCQEWFPHVMACPDGLIFDEKLEICVWSREPSTY